MLTLLNTFSVPFEDGPTELYFTDWNADMNSFEFPAGSARFARKGEYRYGFNGKEMDDEGMGGGGQTYDYGFRIYNPSLGKFLSVDPLSKSYPWYTPYQFAGNEPILCIDVDGLEKFVYRIHEETTILKLIGSSQILSEIYGRVTVPEKRVTVYVSKISKSAYGGQVGFGAVTFPDDLLRSMANLIKQVDATLKYNETYPENKQQINEEIQEQYKKSKAILGAINLSPDQVLNSKDPIYAVLINSESLEKMEVNGALKVLNDFLHEVNAHVEELLNGASNSKESVIDQHGKYFGFDREKYNAGDEKQKALYAKISKGISPSPSEYIEGSEADITYKAIQAALTYEEK